MKIDRLLTNLRFVEFKCVSNGLFAWVKSWSLYKFGLYHYENLRKVRTNAIGINPFKWRKYVVTIKIHYGNDSQNAKIQRMQNKMQPLYFYISLDLLNSLNK